MYRARIFGSRCAGVWVYTNPHNVRVCYGEGVGVGESEGLSV